MRALQFFVDLYEAGGGARGRAELPLGTIPALGFGSGTVAMNLDWAGWVGIFQ